MRISNAVESKMNKRSILIARSFCVLLELTSEAVGQGTEGQR